MSQKSINKRESWPDHGTFFLDSVNVIDNLPQIQFVGLDLGDRSPDTVKERIGLFGIREHLFPQIHSTFGYWQFAVWASKYHHELSTAKILRLRKQLNLKERIGPESIDGAIKGAQWLSTLSQAKSEGKQYAEIVAFIFENSKAVERSRTALSGLKLSLINLQDRDLDKKWQIALRRSLTPAAKEFYRIYRSRKLEGRENIDQILRDIVTGKEKISPDGQILISAAAVYGFLKAIYGFKEETVEGETIRRDALLVEEERRWARALLKGIVVHPTKLSKIALYKQKLIEAEKMGGIWHDIWVKTQGSKKLLVGLKFNRFIRILERSCRDNIFKNE